MAREIPLTQGQVAIVDDNDYAELSKYKWYAHKASGVKGYIAYILRAKKYSSRRWHTYNASNAPTDYGHYHQPVWRSIISSIPVQIIAEVIYGLLLDSQIKK